MAKSPIEQIKELEAQRNQLISEAKKEALSRAQEAIADLNALGFHYYIGETEKNIKPRSRAKRTVADKSARHKPSADKPCPTCNFQTDPPHDKRSHRNFPKPFTAVQLTEWGMTRV